MAYKNFLYGEIADRLLNDYSAAEKLPGERELAEKYHCTRTTIRTALESLQTTGKLKKMPRRGSRLTCKAVPAVQPTEGGCIAMLMNGSWLQDPQYMDMLAGAMSCAAENHFYLSTRLIPEMEEANRLKNLEELLPGCSPAGWVVAYSVPVHLLQLLHRCGRPCVFMGYYPEIAEQLPRNHFFNCYSAEAERYSVGVRHLLEMGHRKILTLGPNQRTMEILLKRLYDQYNADIRDWKNLELGTSPRLSREIPPQALLDQIVGEARRHTAIVIGFGNRIGLAIYHSLIKAGFRIPEDLSVICGSGNFDHFVSEFHLSTLFSDAWQEGAGCVREVVRQLNAGVLQAGTRYTEYEFLDNGSIAPVKP